MKQTIKVAVIGAALAAVSSSYAQTSGLAQSLDVKLTAYVQVPDTSGDPITATKVRISNKEIINELKNNVDVVIEPKAKNYLNVVTSEGFSSVYLKSVFNKVTTWFPLDSWFVITPGTEVNSLKVGGSSIKGTVYSIDQFTMSAPDFGDLTLQGFTSTKVPGYSATSDVNGAGATIDGNNMVSYGTVKVGKVEKTPVVLFQ